MIEVYKFGGASVKDAEGVINLAKIIALNNKEPLLIVVSAMGKTTNALEKLADAYVSQSNNLYKLFEEIKNYHQQILTDLFKDRSHPVFDDIANAFIEIDWILEDEPHPDYDFNYDQLVSVGELVSSKIISAYLNFTGLNTQWIDARGYIQTDNTYRDGQVDWEKTCEAIQNTLPQILQKNIIVTQGFIGGTSENFTTTLGREGSDYTAAIFASCLKADQVTIWKDVPGVLNADPKLFNDTVKYHELPYSEALEMSYYGATIIHPKTIKPLQNANIPLLVKPFLNPADSGTIISELAKNITDIPAIIVKKDQLLVSLSAKDFSFITENHLSEIFKALADAHIKVNLMQISALSFSVCFDRNEKRFKELSESLESVFKIKYNTDIELITIRHFKPDLIEELSVNRTVLMEQFSRNTAQLVLK
ncbi:MAG: aspartate kinase [Daejeonella sp.]